MSFAMFLMCFFKINSLKKEDYKAIVIKVFNRFIRRQLYNKCFYLVLIYAFSYLKLARKLQKTYNMEPAGSHGVWSLDDFQFLPFIFGSAQLSGKIL